ncbi:uncharacterized protein TNCT_679151 [Trichonephila clavata]|uniref:CCHC-type domain-containing protein n=2 Tax=Trichonephila clavata TaxID=2740835 RepID=A0A8X6HQI5_TRICU|nr:uncharacterized protein TNCT_679151 [Trichonephila clavata]
MAFLAKGKKADLVNVCEELGENVPPNSRVPDIKHIILESKNFNEEAVRIMLDRIIGERLEEAEAERQQLEHEAERQRLEREAEQQRLEREAEQRRLEREAEAEQRQIELQRLEIRRLELQAAPAATTPPGRTEEVHHKILLAQIPPKFDEKKDEMSLFLVNFERRAEMARVPREEWAKAPEDIKDHFFGEWLRLKQPEELANKFDEFESLKDSLRNNHHGRKQNESRPNHNDKSRFQDNRRKLSDNHARFRDNRGKYNDNHGRSTENHTRFYDKRQTKTEPGGRGSMPAQSKTSGQKNFRCYECDSPDHLRNACPELRRSQGNEINTHSDTHPVHIVNEVPEEAIEYPDVDLQKFTRQVKIGDFVVTALLDTGSVRNLIRFDVYKRMNPKTKLWRESTVLTGLGQGQVKTLGSFRHVAEIDGHVCRLDFQVVPSAALKFEAIIGSAFLAHAPCPFHEEKVKPESPDWIFNISKKEEQDELDLRHIQNAEIACRVEDIVSSYQPKKTESTDVSMKIILEDEIPVYQRARRLSFPERQEAMSKLDDLDTDFPEVTSAWKTQRATVYVLRDMKHVVEKMLEIYMLDENDAEVLLETGSDFTTFSEDDLILETGQPHEDVKVITSGVLQISGVNEGKKYNMLPNTDSLWYFVKTGSFCEYLNAPESIGILGYLLRTNSDTTVICTKESKLMNVSYSTLEEAENQFGDLSYRMWRPIAIKIAQIILEDEEVYEYWTEERIKIHLEEGIFPDLEGMVDFEIHEAIEDMVLIQGRIEDSDTGVLYEGPAYIPSAVRKMKLIDDPEDRPKVVMILLREEKYHSQTIMGWIKPKDISYKGLCLVHGIRRASLYGIDVS